MHENSYSNDMSRGSSAIAGFVLGTLVGAGVALLLAPTTGEETRRRLGDAARRLREDARGKLDDARGKLDEARGTINDLKEDARSAVETGRDAFMRGRQGREQRASTEGQIG